jgi:uncharacterized membrane protein YqhA
MAKILENCKYVVLIAVVSLMVAAVVTFGWGAVKTAAFIVTLLSSSDDTLAIVSLLVIVDTFLIGTVLFIFSIGLTGMAGHQRPGRAEGQVVRCNCAVYGDQISR